MDMEQELFLNDTLVMAGYDPKVDDFESLKEHMRPILDEYIELNLYKFLNEEQRAEYDRLENKNLEFFKDRIANFDNILAQLHIIRQKQYLNYSNDSED